MLRGGDNDVTWCLSNEKHAACRTEQSLNLAAAASFLLKLTLICIISLTLSGQRRLDQVTPAVFVMSCKILVVKCHGLDIDLTA